MRGGGRGKGREGTGSRCPAEERWVVVCRYVYAVRSGSGVMYSDLDYVMQIGRGLCVVREGRGRGSESEIV